MKRFLSLFLVLIIALCSALALSGCAKNANTAFDIVYITDGASINDKAQNQNAWNGVKNYCQENNLNCRCRYYQPGTDDDGNISVETIDKYISLAVDNGAQYIVMQGDKLAVALNECAEKYSDVNFLLVDAYPHTEGSDQVNKFDNVMTVSFDTNQAGFLAGYACVALGMNKLGYFGSVSDKISHAYGKGFVNGAAYAADEIAKPVYMDYAEYDAQNLDYDYSFTVRPVYQKIEEAKEETFKVTVENGTGSGVYTDGQNVTVVADPAPSGKVFDHWEKKSNTNGVKDKKVNINSDKKDTINLLVGDCDCTLTAVYKDADIVSVNVKGGLTYNVEKNSSAEISAPAAEKGMVFEHWESDVQDVLEDVNSSETKINVAEQSEINLTPVYIKSDSPTFNVTVENGSGSGSYRAGDKVNLVADAPSDGYMFYKWENIDNQGRSTGIVMENEYAYRTSFEMTDRYSSIIEAMYDDGTQVVFGGGNSQSASIFTATQKISHQVYGFGCGIDQNDMGNCLASVVLDYSTAVNNALKSYKGGTDYLADCSNDCLYVTNISNKATYTDDKGNTLDDKNYNEGYANVYTSLKNGSINAGKAQNSKCLTVKYWRK